MHKVNSNVLLALECTFASFVPLMRPHSRRSCTQLLPSSQVSKSGSQAPPAGLEDSLKISLNALRNAAYAEGFAAARGALAASLAGVR